MAARSPRPDRGSRRRHAPPRDAARHRAAGLRGALLYASPRRSAWLRAAAMAVFSFGALGFNGVLYVSQASCPGPTARDRPWARRDGAVRRHRVWRSPRPARRHGGLPALWPAAATCWPASACRAHTGCAAEGANVGRWGSSAAIATGGRRTGAPTGGARAPAVPQLEQQVDAAADRQQGGMAAPTRPSRPGKGLLCATRADVSERHVAARGGRRARRGSPVDRWGSRADRAGDRARAARPRSRRAPARCPPRPTSRGQRMQSRGRGDRRPASSTANPMRPSSGVR